jgi:photosystem II stability/assembly factor-like uncharacterized protein
MLCVVLTGASVEAQNGWMISSSSANNSPPPYYIWHTTNGGSYWTVQYTDSTQGGFNALQFTDLNNGWVVGDSGKILRTTNGGSTWTPVTNTGYLTHCRSKCVFFLNSDVGWIGSKIGNTGLLDSGDRPVVLHTVNGGATWSTQIVPTQTPQMDCASADVFSLCFVDSNNGWFSGDQSVGMCNVPDSLQTWNAAICNTATGGGGGWAIQPNPLAQNINAGKVQFVSPTEGWVSAGNGQLLHTTNAGVNWTAVTPFPNDTAMSMSDPSITMSWADPAHGWKIGWLGTGFSDAHGAVVYQTADGGNTWARKVLSTAAGDLGIQVQFVDENNGWATVANLSTGNGSFMRTTDGGNTWNPVTMTQRVGGIYYYVGAGSGVKENLLNKPTGDRINIFPNPSHGAFRITFRNAGAMPHVEIYNAYGAKVYEASNPKQQTSNEIDLSKYSKGIYFVRISDGQNIHAEKIVIQ